MTSTFQRPADSFAAILERVRVMTPDEIAALDAERDARVERETAEMLRVRQVEIAKRLSDLGERFSERTFATFRCPPGDLKAKSIALEIADTATTSGGWFRSANNGNGKTHLVAAIANSCIDRGIPVTFVSLTRLLDRLRADYDRDGELRNGRIDSVAALASVPVLILDDICKPNATPWVGERMYRLVNDRYERKRPILITSNDSPAEIEIVWREKGGNKAGAVVDRLKEMCQYRVIVAGESYRGTPS